MLAKMSELLKAARRGRYAVGMFNVISSTMASGVLRAAEECRSPIMLSTGEVFLRYWPLEQAAHYFRFAAERAEVPVCVHFDHGKTEEVCDRALAAGFSSIMYDASSLPLEENIKRVREMARRAHSAGAQIEAELGRVGGVEGSMGGERADVPENYYTDPEQAKIFVAETGVDALAVAVGNAHGAYKFPPKLDLARIEALAAAVPVPLVLHGGSGIGDEDFRAAIRNGIAKVNIFTDLNTAGAAAASAALADGGGLTDAALPVIEAVKNATAEKLALFGSAGKA